jgi:hypothetical protein
MTGIFMVFLNLSKQIPEKCIKIAHDYLLQNPYLLMNHDHLLIILLPLQLKEHHEGTD